MDDLPQLSQYISQCGIGGVTRDRLVGRIQSIVRRYGPGRRHLLRPGAGAGAGAGSGGGLASVEAVPWAAILEEVFQAKVDAMGFDRGRDGLDGWDSTDSTDPSTGSSTDLVYRLETSETLHEAEQRRLAAAPIAPLVEARPAPMLTARDEMEVEAVQGPPLSGRPLLSSSSPFTATSLDLDFTPVRSSRPYEPSLGEGEDEAEPSTTKRPRLTSGPGRTPPFTPAVAMAGMSPALGGGGGGGAGGLTPRTPGSTPYGRPTPMPNASTPAAASAVMSAVRTSADFETEAEEERAREVKRARRSAFGGSGGGGGGGGAAEPAPHVAAAFTRERREASAYEQMLASWASVGSEVPVTHTPAINELDEEKEEEDDGVHDVGSFLDAVHDEAAAFEAKLKAMM